MSEPPLLQKELSIEELWGSVPKSEAFPGFEDIARPTLLDPIELLISHEKVKQCVDPSLRLWANAPSLTEFVHRDQLALLHGTVVGLSTRLPIWARDLWKLRRAELASKER